MRESAPLSSLQGTGWSLHSALATLNSVCPQKILLAQSNSGVNGCYSKWGGNDSGGAGLMLRLDLA